jgi:hypothetical protein
VTPPALDVLIGCRRVGCRAVEETIGPWALTPRRDRLAGTPSGGVLALESFLERCDSFVVELTTLRARALGGRP